MKMGNCPLKKNCIIIIVKEDSRHAVPPMVEEIEVVSEAMSSSGVFYYHLNYCNIIKMNV